MAINSILGKLGNGLDGSIFADDLAIYIIQLSISEITFNLHLNLVLIIDHIVVSDEMFNSVKNYSICFDGINLSDHFPLSCQFSIPIINLIYNNNTVYCNDWKKGNDYHLNHYKFIFEHANR